jgi:5-methylcytosine-specific restriction protein A
MLEKLHAFYEALIEPVPQFGPRHPQWKKTRDEYLLIHPTCAACGNRDFLNIHHVMPYHLNPELELAWANLITLCERPARNCHLVFGHLLNWSSYNKQVASDAAIYLNKVRKRP